MIKSSLCPIICLNGMNKDIKEVPRLTEAFYHRDNVVDIARDLLGKELVSFISGQLTSGIIIETEAYAGETDRASHAWNGRRTARTEIMYQRGGIAYIYLCYGIHSLFNVVTNDLGKPHAVLIRGIFPVMGVDIMQNRLGRTLKPPADFYGPGRVTKLLGIDTKWNGTDLIKGNDIWIANNGLSVDKENIVTGPRIGVDYAGEDAQLAYRFILPYEAAKHIIKKAGLK